MDLLKPGAHGLAVQDLQRKLTERGEVLAVDGWYGDATATAVARFQQQAELVVDGVAGPKTLAALRGQADPRHLREADLQAAADTLGVPLACIKAVNATESRGSGFLADGRPVILFERHVFYQRLPHEQAEALAQQYPALCSKARGGYVGGTAEWQRLLNAGQVANALGTAQEAASWGLFQIMGYHWQGLGYAGIGDFVSRMQHREGEHLDAFVRFLQADPALLKTLKARKWAEFARLYNGPAYAENHYDAKLAAAYAKAERLAA